MLAKLTPIALWKRFFSAYHSAWFERARARAATNPRYAEIDQRRREAAAADPYPDPDALPILSVDTLFEQLDILSDLNPPTWAHRFDAWLHVHPGVAHPFRTLAAFWHRGRHGWAPADTHNLSQHLSSVIAGSVAHFRQHTDSRPMNVSEEEWAATLSEIERGFRAHAEGSPVFDSVAGRAAALKRLADKYPYVAEASATGGFSDGVDNLVLEERLVEAQLEESLALLGRWYRHLWS